MADAHTNPTLDEVSQFSNPARSVALVSFATIVLVVVAVVSGWWDVLKMSLVVVGPVLGILIARHAGWRGIFSIIVAGAIGGALALGSFGFYAVLFPLPQEPGVIAWGGRRIDAAIYLSFMGGLFGGFCGAIVGLVIGITGWLFSALRMSRP